MDIAQCQSFLDFKMTRFLNYTAVDSTINWERIDTIRQRLTKRQASLCSQRAVFYTQSFQESEGEPYIVRKAKAFAYTLEHMDLYIEPDLSLIHI